MYMLGIFHHKLKSKDKIGMPHQSVKTCNDDLWEESLYTHALELPRTTIDLCVYLFMKCFL